MVGSTGRNYFCNNAADGLRGRNNRPICCCKGAPPRQFACNHCDGTQTRPLNELKNFGRGGAAGRFGRNREPARDRHDLSASPIPEYPNN